MVSKYFKNNDLLIVNKSLEVLLKFLINTIIKIILNYVTCGHKIWEYF